MDDMLEIDIDSITIPPNRQRQRMIIVDNPGGLMEDIEKQGQLQPIIVTEKHDLIAGERRLTAMRLLGYETIKALVRNMEDGTKLDRVLVEFSENHQRKDLHWADKARALRDMHLGLVELHGDGWSVSKSAAATGFVSAKWLSVNVNVAQAMDHDPNLEKESNLERASSQVERRLSIQRDREQAQLRSTLAAPREEIDDIEKEIEEFLEEPTPEEIEAMSEEEKEELKAKPAKPSRKVPAPTKAPPPPVEEHIIVNADCYEWAKTYSGEMFDIAHLDPPYGININKAGMAKTNGIESYEDTEDMYWRALEFFLNEWDGLAAYAHAIVWCDPKQIWPTMEWFDGHGWEACNRPLVWTKSDNKGTIPVIQRDPRWTYETAVLARRGGRQVSSNVAGHYNCPTSKEIHGTEKPIPMLKHFLRLVEQGGSRMIDPMCGSGNSIRAFSRFADVSSVGVEINPDWAAAGSARLKQDLGLVKASGAVGSRRAPVIDVKVGGE